MTSLPTVLLFGLERSVYTRIARLALEEKQISYSLQEVEIFGAGGVPEEHLKRHPFGRIPVLQCGALSIYETSAITRYVDEAFAGPALQPSKPLWRSRMNQVIGLLDAYAYRPMVWGVFVQRVRIPLVGGTPNEAKIASSLQSAAVCLRALEVLLESAPFLAGEQISLADLHAFPILRYFCLAPEGHSMLESHRALFRWYEVMRTRPSVFRTKSQYELAKS